MSLRHITGVRITSDFHGVFIDIFCSHSLLFTYEPSFLLTDHAMQREERGGHSDMQGQILVLMEQEIYHYFGYKPLPLLMQQANTALENVSICTFKANG